jgi:hypothetical protein
MDVISHNSDVEIHVKQALEINYDACFPCNVAVYVIKLGRTMKYLVTSSFA